MSEETDRLIETLSDHEHRLAAEVAVGELISDARQREAFRMMFMEAKSAAIKARNEFVSVDPTDVAKITALQNDAKRYEEMAEWMRTAINKGEQSFSQLQAERGETPSDGESHED